jgi:TetR/AcrR family transcriptional regulator, mexJK operon transcriptional repressor
MTDTASERRDAPAGSKQAQILEAAGELFLDQGFGATSMDAVARRAGVSKATLYAHFSGKEELFSAIISNKCGKQARLFEATASDGADLRDVLTEIGHGLLTLLLSPQAIAMYRVVVAEAERFPKLGHAFFRSGPDIVRRRIRTFLEEAGRQGQLALPDPDRAAEHLIGMLMTPVHGHRVLGIKHRPPSEAELDDVVRSAVDAFLRAYAAARG